MHLDARIGSFGLLFIVGLAACGDDTGAGGSGGDPSGGTAGATGGEGGDGAGDGSGGSGDEAAQAAYCEDLVARDAQCGEDTTLAECNADIATTCIFHGMRDGVAEAVAACILDRACDAEGDLENCVYGPGQEQPIPEQEAWRDACLARRDACGGVYADDDCYVSFLRAEAYADLQPCLDQACVDVPGCTRNAVATACGG